MEATRRNLQARLKVLQNYQNIKSTYQKEMFPKNSMFSTLKKKSQKFYGSYTTEFAGSTQNPKQIIQKPNQIIRSKIFPKKKSVFSNIKVGKIQKFV
jgi:hypothetical protein